MKSNDLIDIIGEAPGTHIRDAKSHKKSKLPHWSKWGAVAACLCLVTVLGIGLSRPKGRQDSVMQIVVLEHNGCYYEAVDIPAVLERYGLPTTITEELAGDPVGYFKSDGIAGYKPTPLTTDIQLYDYAPVPSQATYLLRDGNHWYAALFVGFRDFGSGNTNVALTELYRIYEIQASADIASVAKIEMAPLLDSGRNRDKIIGSPVTDPQEIKTFYGITTSLESFGNDDFQRLVFGDVPEKNVQAAHNAFQEGAYTLRIETVDGLRFFIRVYPTSKWIYGDGTNSYYQINDEMTAWLDRNIG